MKGILEEPNIPCLPHISYYPAFRPGLDLPTPSLPKQPLHYGRLSSYLSVLSASLRLFHPLLLLGVLPQLTQFKHKLREKECRNSAYSTEDQR